MNAQAIPTYRRNQLVGEKLKLAKLREIKYEEFQSQVRQVVFWSMVVAFVAGGWMFWTMRHDFWNFWGVMVPGIISAFGCIIGSASAQSLGRTPDEVDELDVKIQALDLELAE